MTKLFALTVALGIVLAVPIQAYPADGAPVQKHSAIHHMGRDMARATALVAPAPALSAPARKPRTDGLSRDDDDCNYGCIDH
jgi:hypothetical protein